MLLIQYFTNFIISRSKVTCILLSDALCKYYVLSYYANNSRIVGSCENEEAPFVMADYICFCLIRPLNVQKVIFCFTILQLDIKVYLHIL